MWQIGILALIVTAIVSLGTLFTPKLQLRDKYIDVQESSRPNSKITVELVGPSPKIMGAHKKSIKRPFPVSIQLREGYHFCGGALIEKNWVLTTGHCVDVKRGAFQVRVGSENTVEGGEVLRVRKIYEHTNYTDDSFDYDFALLEIDEATISDTVRTVDLVTKNVEFDDGQLFNVSSWLNLPVGFSTELRTVEVAQFNFNKCNESYYDIPHITSRNMCAGYNEKHTKSVCQFDSGAPLTTDNGTLVGLFSWSLNCVNPKYPGVYSRVAAVKDWITKITGSKTN